LSPAGTGYGTVVGFGLVVVVALEVDDEEEEEELVEPSLRAEPLLPLVHPPESTVTATTPARSALHLRRGACTKGNATARDLRTPVTRAMSLDRSR
jgi:hypothetical protein